MTKKKTPRPKRVKAEAVVYVEPDLDKIPEDERAVSEVDGESLDLGNILVMDADDAMNGAVTVGLGLKTEDDQALEREFSVTGNWFSID